MIRTHHPEPDPHPEPRRSPDSHAPSSSLDQIGPGECVRLGRVVFDLVRGRCWEWGLVEGETVLCSDVLDDELILIRSDGEAVRIGREYARFIEVLPGEAPPPARRRARRRRRRSTSRD